MLISSYQARAFRPELMLAALAARQGRVSDPGNEEQSGKILHEVRFAFALALDHDKRQVDSITSNMAHLLWCGVPSPQEAEQVATHLASPAMASGWGLRTLSTEMAGYNPISYHLGSVWPHDTVIACEGLRRYGLDDVAMRLAGDVLDALAICPSHTMATAPR